VAEDYTELIDRGFTVFNEKGPQAWVDSRLWTEVWEEFTVVPRGTTEGPDGQLLIEIEQRAVARSSGMEITGSGFFYVVIFRDGKIAEIHLFNDREQASRLAGLPEQG
jgi:ketosteroid isomerase-like protein